MHKLLGAIFGGFHVLWEEREGSVCCASIRTKGGRVEVQRIGRSAQAKTPSPLEEPTHLSTNLKHVLEPHTHVGKLALKKHDDV